MLGSLACRSDPPRAVIPALDAGDAAGRDAGEERTPDAAPDVGPPLTVPGLALWLDPRVGLEVSAGAVTSWTDRSPYRHRLVAEAPDMETRPAPAPLAGRP
ncbi:MAG TPA: hypothetical protein VN914_10965, partial [Polyangia bacterium]|nr:hypothetical protein [Polyangia bacterium]